MWPWLLWLALRVLPSRAWLTLATLAAAVGSAVALGLRYHAGSDPTRAYEATDARAFELLFGAALAMVWPSRRLRAGIRPSARNVLDAVGLAGLAGVLVLVWRTDSYSPFLYRGALVHALRLGQPGQAGMVHRRRHPLHLAPGALAWNELASPDVDASAQFYGELFGWTTDPFEGSPQRYLVIKNGGRANGGIRELGDQPAPPHWLVYFGIDEIEAGLAKVEELGGSKMAGPIDIGMAKVGVVDDPQGAVFAIYDGQFED